MNLLAYLLPDPEHSATARLLLVAGYGVAALCWLRAGARARQGREHSFARWWMLGAGLLLFLAINKQLDLRAQSEAALRSLARAGGWYEQRRSAQFILAMGLPCLAAFAAGALLLTKGRSFARGHPLAALGWLLLLLYLALRQTQEWKPILRCLEALKYHDWRLALELAGILLVALAALRSVGASHLEARRSDPEPQE